MIDLHCHSTYSDGSLNPGQLVDMARAAGLKALALTDHDTTTGVGPFQAAGQALEDGTLECLSGVEISVEFERGTIHILGYFLDPGDAQLETALGKIREGRTSRNSRIVSRLNELGLDISDQDVAAYAGEQVVGRVHIAQALIEKGFVKDKQAAFKRYLAKGKPAYEDRYRLSPEDGIRMIRDAGGAAVLAHPATLTLGKKALREQVGAMREMGLAGLEIFYPLHPPKVVKEYLSLARAFDLVITGGSDFHGDANPAIKMGRGFGSLHVDDDLLEPLRARAGI